MAAASRPAPDDATPAPIGAREMAPERSAPVMTGTPATYLKDLTGGVQHWTHFPVRVAFAAGSTLTPDRQAAIESGFDEWAKATGREISYVVVSTAADADVVVHCDLQKDRSLTQTDYDPATEKLTHADVNLGLASADGVGASIDVGDLQALAAHEFGHALGINGHSSSPGDVMFQSVEDGRKVDHRDVNTLLTGYGVSSTTASRA